MLWIDSVRLRVDDLDAATAHLVSAHGLAVAEVCGPQGPTRLAPAGPAFLELMTDDHPPRWSVASDDFDAQLRRLRRPVETFTWRYPNGVSGRCRAIIPDDRHLPSIVDWGTDPHPSRLPVPHRQVPLGISCLTSGCDRGALRSWLGADAADLPIHHVHDGTDAVESVHLALADARVILHGSHRNVDEYAV